MKRTINTGEMPVRVSSIRRYRQTWALALLLLFVNLISGCYYYKVVQGPRTAAGLEELQAAAKLFFLHSPNGNWFASDIRLDLEKNVMYAVLDNIPGDHWFYQETRSDRANRYFKSEGDPTTEVHLYATENPQVQEQRADLMPISGTTIFLMPLDKVEKVEVYEFDRSTSTTSTVFAVIGVIAGIAIIAGLIYALTKSSCPFVYIQDGDNYRFVGEMYGGAIRPGLERDDYMPLPGFAAQNGEYRLKISNELKERQYTDLAELVVIDHPQATRALMDEYGRVHTITRPESPTTVVSDNMTDYRQAISTVDSAWMMFNDDPDAGRAMSSLTMTFPRPADADTGKLVLHAKNSLWLDYIFGKFTEQFGTYYPTFQEKQRALPANEKGKWAREQGLSLSVYLKEGKQWTYVDDIPMVGPLASRDLVMPVDLRRVKGDEVTVKLTCGFMFWEVDYAAMDFSPNLPATMTGLKPLTAIDEKGQDVRAELTETDKVYLSQPEVGNEALITYAAGPATPGMERTVFLHTRGYYEYVRDYTNEPNLGYVKTFKKQGAFTKFSRERYQEQLAREDLWASPTSFTHEK